MLRFLPLLAVLVMVQGPARETSAPHVRGVNDYSQWLVDAALERSPTVVDLDRRLERTDVTVYVRTDMVDSRFESHTRLIGAGQRRYVMISLSKSMPPARKIELLGHELQHVAEIATDPRARDADSLRALFARIGEEHARNHFETAQARQAAESVRVEVAQAEPLATAW